MPEEGGVWQWWRVEGRGGGEAWADRVAHRTHWVLTLMENTTLSTLNEAPAAKDCGPTQVSAIASSCLEHGPQVR